MPDPIHTEATFQAEGATKRPRSWWGVNEVKPFEIAIHVPWFGPHKPFVALHVSQWGYEGSPRGWRRVLHVQLIWGRLFSDRSAYKVWRLLGRPE